MVIGFDTSGKVIYNLQDSIGNCYAITSVNEYDGYLYLCGGMGYAAKYKLKWKRQPSKRIDSNEFKL